MNEKTKIPPLPALDIDAVIHPDGLRMRHLGERRVVWALIHHLENMGFKLLKVDEWALGGTLPVDDGGRVLTVPSPRAAMEIIFNLDECHLHFAKEGGPNRWVFLVMGNDPEEVICDYTCAGGFDTVMATFDPASHV